VAKFFYTEFVYDKETNRPAMNCPQTLSLRLWSNNEICSHLVQWYEPATQ